MLCTHLAVMVNRSSALPGQHAASQEEVTAMDSTMSVRVRHADCEREMKLLKRCVSRHLPEDRLKGSIHTSV